MELIAGCKCRLCSGASSEREQRSEQGVWPGPRRVGPSQPSHTPCSTPVSHSLQALCHGRRRQQLLQHSCIASLDANQTTAAGLESCVANSVVQPAQGRRRQLRLATVCSELGPSGRRASRVLISQAPRWTGGGDQPCGLRGIAKPPPPLLCSAVLYYLKRVAQL